MIIFAYTIPIFTCFILFLFFRRQTMWWEYLVVFFPSLLGTLLVSLIIEEIKISDTKWISEEVIKITHEDDWDRWVHKTCHRTVRVGKTSHVVSYNCSYRKYYPDRWYKTTKGGKQIDITREEYNRIKDLWGTPEIFLEMNRKYYKKDGDAQYHESPGIKEKTETVGFSKRYHNYFQSKTSLYSLADVPDSLSHDLYKYPELKMKEDQEFWLGWNPEDETKRWTRWINSRSPEFRVFVLVWKNKVPKNIGDLQRRYWKGGNSNEVVFMIFLDTNKIEKFESFSFSEDPRLENYVKLEILPGQKWDPKKLLEKIESGYKLGYWKPRDFENYSYIDITFGGTDYFIIFLITCLINFGISIWVIQNEFKRW